MSRKYVLHAKIIFVSLTRLTYFSKNYSSSASIFLRVALNAKVEVPADSQKAGQFFSELRSLPNNPINLLPSIKKDISLRTNSTWQVDTHMVLPQAKYIIFIMITVVLIPHHIPVPQNICNLISLYRSKSLSSLDCLSHILPEVQGNLLPMWIVIEPRFSIRGIYKGDEFFSVGMVT